MLSVVAFLQHYVLFLKQHQKLKPHGHSVPETMQHNVPTEKYANITGETFVPNPPPVGTNVCQIIHVSHHIVCPIYVYNMYNP